jgi:cell division protein FtsN
MPSRRGKNFEFRVGTVGLTLFTVGISVLLLGAFVFGVFVGKNIESYPHKIAAMPTTITQKIVNKEPEAPATGKKEDFSFTFYDTLSQKKEEAVPAPAEPPVKAAPKESAAPPKSTSLSVGRAEETQQKETQPTGNYMIQVASFKDKSRMEGLRSKLISLGYSPAVEERTLANKGTWFRLSIYGFESMEAAKRESAKIERNVRGLKCLVRIKK